MTGPALSAVSIGVLAVVLAGTVTGCARALPATAPPVSAASTAGSDRSAPTSAPPPVGSVPASAGPTPATAASGSGTCASPSPTGVSIVRVGEPALVAGVQLTSDGTHLTVGRRTHGHADRPALSGPDGIAAPPDLLRTAANLLSADRSLRLLVGQPPAPDDGLRAGRPPYDVPGRYVVYTVAEPVRAEIATSCDGLEQRWQLTGSANAATGSLRCEVSQPDGTVAASIQRRLC